MCVRVLTLGAKVEARMSVCPSELDKSEEDVVFGGYGYSGNNDELLEICLLLPRQQWLLKHRISSLFLTDGN